MMINKTHMNTTGMNKKGYIRRGVAALVCAAAASIGASAQSPYISKVYEYCPAPGQFVNVLPAYEEGDDANMMRLKAEECLADNERILVSLGGYGGYVVFGFDHAIENRRGQYDVQILGNAFYAEANPNSDAPAGGSCEPGIVMVSYDANGNGKPDDPWYELAGSEYGKPTTIHNYRISYFRPDPDKQPTPDPDNPKISDTTYIRWVDSEGQEGYINRNVYHSQSYFPLWSSQDELTFQGALLPDNAVDESGTGSYYVQYAYAWGYADNHPNTSNGSKFDIDWAVDAQGRRVHLPGAHFFKVYTALNQQCGWIGETSTEIMGATDLHLTGGDDAVPSAIEPASRLTGRAGAPTAQYNLQGMAVGEQSDARRGSARVTIVKTKDQKTKKIIQ